MRTRLRFRSAVVVGTLLAMSSVLGTVSAAPAASDPAPLAEPEFQYWFAPPGAAGELSRIDVGGSFVVAADSLNDVVHVFEDNGAFVRTLTGPGGALGDFQGVAGVAVAPSGRVVVTDDELDRVSVFGPGGVHKFTFGSSGSGPGLFDSPRDVEVGAGGDIYVADGGNSRVQIFDSTGSYQSSIGPDIGGAADPLWGASAIAVVSDGSLLIRHYFVNSRVYRVDLSGNLITDMAGFTGGAGLAGAGVSVDSEDRIWVGVTHTEVHVRTLDNVPLGVWDVSTAVAPVFTASGAAITAETRLDVHKFYECNNRLATYVGTPSDDFVTGTNQDDVAVMRGGDDLFFGGPGRDTICGGPGADRLHGGPGLDRIYGQGGPDELYGNGHKDRIFGGDGLDVIFGGTGPDWLYGGNHRDELRGGNGPDNLFGGNGPDQCFGGPEIDAAASCASETGIP